MPGDPSPKASPGGIIAYNCDSARGWNDPPTFAFSANKANNKPKLDLRKRVSHQQALAGRQIPPTAPNAFTVNHEVTEAVAGLALNGAAQQVFMPSPVTTPPVSSSSLIPPSYTRSASAPSLSNGSINNINQAPTNKAPSADMASLQTSAAQPSEKLIGQPLFDLKNHSYDPVMTAPLHSIRSTAEISDHCDDHNYHTSPQIFHPVMPPVTTNPITNSYQEGTVMTQPCPPSLHASPHIFNPITPPVTTGNTASTYQDGGTLPQPGLPQGQITSSPPLPYQPPVGHATPPLYGTSGQNCTGTVVSTQVKLLGGHMTPPPDPVCHVVPPTSLSAGSSPRSSSPSSHEKDTDETSLMDDEQGLKLTMDALQDVISKLHDRLEKRVADDISRRLQMMSQSWKDGKLSKGVKSRMIRLAKVLDDGDVDAAHHIHVSLMVDFVAEVKQWMVAVKKLISLVSSSNVAAVQSR